MADEIRGYKLDDTISDVLWPWEHPSGTRGRDYADLLLTSAAPPPRKDDTILILKGAGGG